MKSAWMTLVLMVLTSAAQGEQPHGTEMSAGYRLQPASDEPLRSVPEQSVYQPLWPDSMQPSGMIQAGYSPSDVTSSEQPAESSANATTKAAPPPAKPFLDLANESANEQPAMANSTDDGTKELFVRLAVWTVIILCLCVLTLLGLRRWQRRQGILPAKAGHARVLETLAIGPGRAVSLIQLGSVRAVVGTDSSGIKTIVLAPPAFDEELDQFESEPPQPEFSGHVV